MTSLKPYVSVLHQQFLNSFAKVMAFRVSMLLGVLVEWAVFFTFYLTARFLFNHIDHIGAWDRSEFMFFTFWYLLVMSTHNAFLAPNFWNFSMEVRTGNLDFRLLRPLGSLFDVFTSIQRPASIMMLPVHAGFLVYFGIDVHLAFMSWLLIPPLLVLSFALVSLMEMAIVMMIFWTKGGDGINFIRMQCQQVQRWPDFMYPDGIRIIFSTLIPILIAVTFPVRFILDKREWKGLVAVAVAVVVFWLLVRTLWSSGLRRYESASS
jgi:ABC-2 type transport system permease protein